MTGKRPLPHLSRRESQIMEIIYRRTRATAAEVHKDLPEPPGYTAVRTMLTILERKGYLKHTRDGVRYVYFATTPRSRAQKPALRRLVDTFFEGSGAQAMVALLDISSKELSDDDIKRLEEAIAKAHKRRK